MFSIKYKEYAVFLLASISMLLVACNPEGNSSKKETSKDSPLNEVQSLSEEEQIIRQIESELKIPATEKYDIQIIPKHINPDTLIDALILVNRKEHALKEVKNNNKERFFEKTGETGTYNYVFVKLGGVDRILNTTAVGSNVNYPLHAQFLELTSAAYQDFYVEYRIKNSVQRNYYTVRNHQIYLTFSCPVFDNIGKKEPLVYDIRHLENSVRLSKDIALYHASFLDYNPNDIEDINYYSPKEIIGTDQLYVYFIFDEKTMKYKTPMKAPEQN